ncbi:hypothetical protein COE54_26980 [Bacillus cereus]|uniref:hypothetical protein n=1 Tax=Bacillus cereus TaxID=1396 RepID=UPI000BFAAAB1|nr:hypothetical protein [Bacillus cereus]PEX58490.1 hypothetical protein CN462_30110 [Bacillus cereus]PFS32585.1 hypothetical protein COK47_10890 [Bacillus cereus]PGZ25493.1 hypothetical protein COE54_26980 [Bacillus cereus]
MYQQQNDRDRDQEMMFSIQGIPTNKANMNQLPKWIGIFGYGAFTFMALSGLAMLILSIFRN